MDVSAQSYNSTSTSHGAAGLAPSGPPVIDELSRLHKNNGRLANMVDTLGSRLDGVLRAVPPAEHEPQTRRAGESAMHEELIAYNEEIEGQIERISHAIDRLTV